jgi:hypothetical protein
MRRILRLCVLLTLAAASGLRAQGPARRGDPLSARMDAFLHALEELRGDTLVTFLPRRGDWTWVLTTRYPGGVDRLGRWRFPPDEFLRAIDERGPLCESFSPGGDVIPLGTLMYNVLMESDGPWRRVSGNRFVPPGAPARSPVFVEWRREDGRWVLSAYGDERRGETRLLGRASGSFNPDPAQAAAAEGAYASGKRWFADNEPMRVDGVTLVKYGLPRAIPRELLAPYGVMEDVPVYREIGTRGVPEVVYVAESPGKFQPYQNMTGNGCM